LTKQSVFIKSLLLFLVLFVLAGVVHSETILVTPGNSGTDNPPGDDTPTTDYIECPEGYSCIKADDYSQFISSLKDFTEEINERTLFIEDVFDRFDKKIQIDENYISLLSGIAEEAQRTAREIKKEKDKEIESLTGQVNVIKIQNKTVEIQLAELRAQLPLMYVLILIGALLTADLLVHIKGHGKFLWRRFQELVPIKFG